MGKSHAMNRLRGRTQWGGGGRLCCLAVRLDHRKMWGRIAQTFLGYSWESWAELSEVTSTIGDALDPSCLSVGLSTVCSGSVGGEFLF